MNNEEKWRKECREYMATLPGYARSGFSSKQVEMVYIEARQHSEKELEKYKAALEVLKENNDFYANTENYYSRNSSNLMVCIDSDLEEYDCICGTSPFAKNCRCLFFAGKRAREASKRAAEILGE